MEYPLPDNRSGKLDRGKSEDLQCRAYSIRMTIDLFERVVPVYDSLNHLFSLGIDRRWRRRLVRRAGAPPDAQILDACTGTADVAIEFCRRLPSCRVTGVGLSERMLLQAHRKLARRKLQQRVTLLRTDVQELPFPDATFDRASICFGLRNLADRAKGIGEIARVLKPQGRLLILEFFPPGGNLFGRLYRFYLGGVMPCLGDLLSGSRPAYRYLYESVISFAALEEVVQLLRAAGMRPLKPERLTGGIVFLLQGIKV
jgi:demethylmenaquinone methyltransferase/2-methoxy-6-polyprenyl-1,4-benzoquinol methylase